MSDEQFQAWNHFVPRLYLKRFASAPGLLWHYPLLVSHPSVPEWNRLAISKAAAHRHLYTVANDLGESDEIERWLAREFDDPAEEAVERVVSGATMNRAHWRRLARFFGAQHARTPAHYLSSQQHWQRELQPSMNETLEGLRQDFIAMKERGELPAQREPSEIGLKFPIRTIVEQSDEPGMALLKVQVNAGRKLWMWGMRHTLRRDGPLTLLEQHRWTILTAPSGYSWFTSDNPAVQSGVGVMKSKPTYLQVTKRCGKVLEKTVRST